MRNVIKLFLVGFLIVGLSSFVSNDTAVVEKENLTTKYAEMTFNKSMHDFGTIKEGEVVTTSFEYKNTGEEPLVIVSMKGSCGCTVANDWNKDPIAPGETGTFKVSFNSKGKPNLQQKTVTIVTNTKKGREYVKIKAMVTPKSNTG